MGNGELLARPRVIDAIADDVDQMAGAAKKASHYAEDHLNIEIGSGTFANLSKNHLDDIWYRAHLDYPEAAQMFRKASRGLSQVADDYRKTDHVARQRFEKKYLSLGESSLTSDPEETDWRDTPGIKQSDVSHVLSPPGDAYRESWVDLFREMDEWVEKITSLGQDIEHSKIFGIENPAAGWADDWEGDWKKFGTAVTAIDILGEFWQRLGSEARATMTRFEGNWEGRAAGAAYYWLERNADEMITHGKTLQDNASELFASVLAVNEIMSPIFDFLSDLFDTIGTITSLATEMDVDFNVKDPLGTLGSIADLFGGKVKKLGELISHGLELVGNASKIINVVRGLGSAMVAVFQDLTTESELDLFSPDLDPRSIGAGGRH